MLKQYIYLVFLLTVCWIMAISSCKHQPLFDMDDVEPIDTTMNPDANPMNPVDETETDTTVTATNPCAEDLIYFNRDVLPLLKSNCAFSGCHDASSAQDGVILESYETVIATADVKKFNLADSELYEVLVEDDVDDRMPPAPRQALSTDQIQVIAQWILQGAENLSCDENSSGCDTTQISYADFVQPLLTTNCTGCHSGSNPSGGIGLDSYTKVVVVAQNGKLYGAVNHNDGFKAMPQGGGKLPECDINKLKAWIDSGAQNN